MYAVNLYVFQRREDNLLALVYGFALEIGEAGPGPWKSLQFKGSRRWKLICFRRLMEREELNEFLGQFSSARQVAIEGKIILTPKWEVRPAIYVPGREEHVEGGKSLTDRTARGRIYYALGKTSYLEKLFPADKINREEVKKELEKLAAILQEEVGIELLGRDRERFGNLEIYDGLDGFSLLEPPGLHMEMVREIKAHPERSWQKQPVSRGVKIWADETMGENLPVWINVTLYNGRGDSKTIVADKLMQLTRAGKPVTVEAAEPISSLAVKVWTQKGEILHYSCSHLIRSINIDLNVKTGERKIIDPWSEKLPRKYREQVEKFDTFSGETIKIGGYPFDPWIPEGERFKQMLSSLFTPPSRSRFFEATQPGQVSFFNYLQSLTERNEVQKVIFVDPFFGAEAALQLLPRLKRQSSLAVEVITSLVDKKVSRDDATPPLEQMKAALQRNKTLLPSRLKVYNVQNQQATEQQFHDRFLLLETRNGMEGWILGNSFHSQSQNYPALMVELPENVLGEILHYLDQLRQGNDPGKKEARSVILWDSKAGGEEAGDGRQDLLPGNLDPFPHWEWIPKLLTAECADSLEALEQIIKQGYLEVSQGVARWLTADKKRPEIISRVKNCLEKLLAGDNTEGQITSLFNCLAHWTYRGAGFSAADILVKDKRITAHLLRVLHNVKNEIENHLAEKEKQWLQLKKVYDDFSEDAESYRECLILYEHAFEFDSLLKEKAFFADFLWYVDPQVYYQELDRNWVLLSHWLYILFRRKDFSNYQGSKIATRFISLRFLSFSFFPEESPEKTFTLEKEPLPAELKLKTFMTLLGIQRKERQEKLAAYIPAFIGEAGLDEREILPFLAGIQHPLLARLADDLDDSRPELAKAVREHIVQSFVNDLTAKEPLYFHYSLDYPKTGRMVEASFKIYRPTWCEWYREQFLPRLKWREYKDPFLRFSHYTRWYTESIRLLWALLVGLIYLEKLSATQEIDPDQADVLKEIIDHFERYLVPNIWHLPLREILLDDVLYMMGLLSEKLNLNEHQKKLVALIDRRQVQLPRKLNVYLSSLEIFKNHKQKVLEILDSPTLTLWLGQDSISRLQWVADRIKKFSNQLDTRDKELIQSLQLKILSLIDEISDDPLDLLWKLKLNNPLEFPSEWGKWADILKVDYTSLKKAWQKETDTRFFGKLLALGLYLFGSLEGFQSWLHAGFHYPEATPRDNSELRDDIQKDFYGQNNSPWYRILNGYREQVLEELVRHLVGIPR